MDDNKHYGCTPSPDQRIESNRMTRSWTVLATLALLLTACATSPTGRSQLIIFPDSQVDQMGAAAFSELKRETPPSGSAVMTRYITCIADAITAALPASMSRGWEVAVFDVDQINAFALPGRKIGIYSGMLDVASSQDQLASVIGHEVGHVLARHSNERLSTQYATETGLNVLGTITSGSGRPRDEVFAVLGVGAQVGILLPYGRAQENEADIIGLDLMARAGFDPRESVILWRKMSEKSGSNPPQILSTHPSDQTRIANLTSHMGDAVRTFEAARQAGHNPRCR